MKKKAKFEGWPKRLLGTAGVWLAFVVILLVVFMFNGERLDTAAAIGAIISIFPALIYLIGGPNTVSGLFAGLNGL